MSRDYFAFRQFSIRQDRCAMKVSSDAVIFGAWVNTPKKPGARILDIGAGTGLLSLMLAQRSAGAAIDAVEIDAEAAVQAMENVADSVFSDRIRIINEDALQYSPAAPYDLIISNPPFFSKSLHGPDDRRNVARHAGALNLATLFETASGALACKGAFALLMPLASEMEILTEARQSGLHLHATLRIQDNPGSLARRGCWIFRRTPVTHPEDQRLVIRDDAQYTSAYISLLRDYYLFLP